MATENNASKKTEADLKTEVERLRDENAALKQTLKEAVPLSECDEGFSCPVGECTWTELEELVDECREREEPGEILTVGRLWWERADTFVVITSRAEMYKTSKFLIFKDRSKAEAAAKKIREELGPPVLQQ